MLPGERRARNSASVFARMILALLLAAFAVPAMASGPCHDSPAMMPGMMMAGMAAPMAQHRDAQHDRSDQPRGMAPHVCIGCIPPAMIAPRPVSTPFDYAPMPRAIVTTAFAAGLRAPPILPPPRPQV
jgi:hypothetical protein